MLDGGRPSRHSQRPPRTPLPCRASSRTRHPACDRRTDSSLRGPVTRRLNQSRPVGGTDLALQRRPLSSLGGRRLLFSAFSQRPDMWRVTSVSHSLSPDQLARPLDPEPSSWRSNSGTKATARSSCRAVALSEFAVLLLNGLRADEMRGLAGLGCNPFQGFLVPPPIAPEALDAAATPSGCSTSRRRRPSRPPRALPPAALRGP